MMDINLSQRLCGIIKGTFSPLSKELIPVINKYVTTPEIREYIFQVSRDMEEEIAAKMEANKKKTGYVLHDAPTMKADSIFEAIVSQYPGKVLFIDVWATWCSPCKDGIKRMKPLKEEFKDKDIEFIYLAEPSSPLETYNLLIPDIKGQHYRLDKDAYHYIKSRFKLAGIPRYMLVGKDGKMIKDNLWTESFSNETLRDLFNEHLK
jgi:thiol-disulfide isomerase/thioredoxin